MHPFRALCVRYFKEPQLLSVRAGKAGLLTPPQALFCPLHRAFHIPKDDAAASAEASKVNERKTPTISHLCQLLPQAMNAGTSSLARKPLLSAQLTQPRRQQEAIPWANPRDGGGKRHSPVHTPGGSARNPGRAELLRAGKAGSASPSEPGAARREAVSLPRPSRAGSILPSTSE